MTGIRRCSRPFINRTGQRVRSKIKGQRSKVNDVHTVLNSITVVSIAS